jgi:hypothetical protein
MDEIYVRQKIGTGIEARRRGAHGAREAVKERFLR